MKTKKLKTTFDISFSTILYINYYHYSLSGSNLSKIVLAMLYICKMEITHVGVVSAEGASLISHIIYK